MRFTREDIKISFDKPVYYVNEEKKTVVCTLNYTVFVPLNYDVAAFDVAAFYYSIDNFSGSVTTKAKCHPDDVFDSDLGCDIAFARAENAAYSDSLRRITDSCNVFKIFLKKVDAFKEKTIAHNNHNNDYVAELSEKSNKKTKD